MDFGDLRGGAGTSLLHNGPLPRLRPFLAPIFAWSAVVGRKGKMKLLWLVAFLLSYVSEFVQGEGRFFKIDNVMGNSGRPSELTPSHGLVGRWEFRGRVRPESVRSYSETVALSHLLDGRAVQGDRHCARIWRQVT